METLWKVKEAFGCFGAIPANIQWSWSARSPDGKTVVVNWWKDLKIRRDNKLVMTLSSFRICRSGETG
jgi:hypothetical protein